jgi:hypothetical protein
MIPVAEIMMDGTRVPWYVPWYHWYSSTRLAGTRVRTYVPWYHFGTMVYHGTKLVHVYHFGKYTYPLVHTYTNVRTSYTCTYTCTCINP